MATKHVLHRDMLVFGDRTMINNSRFSGATTLRVSQMKKKKNESKIEYTAKTEVGTY